MLVHGQTLPPPPLQLPLQGELLLSVQLIPKPDAHMVLPPPPPISPSMRACFVEIVLVGVRHLKHFMLLPPRRPHVRLLFVVVVSFLLHDKHADVVVVVVVGVVVVVVVVSMLSLVLVLLLWFRFATHTHPYSPRHAPCWSLVRFFNVVVTEATLLWCCVAPGAVPHSSGLLVREHVRGLPAFPLPRFQAPQRSECQLPPTHGSARVAPYKCQVRTSFHLVWCCVEFSAVLAAF